MWKCPTCKREFSKAKQTHSCVVYSIENHFTGKEEVGKRLFDTLIKRIKEKVGPVKIESLPCCIHLLGSFAFGGVWIGKDKIKLDFRLDHLIKDKRISKSSKISANRYMHYLEITNEKGIDSKLLGWIKEAYYLDNKKEILKK